MVKNVFKYLAYIFGILGICITIQYTLAATPSMKWTYIRYCVVVSILLPALLNKINSIGIIRTFVFFVYISTVVPLTYKYFRQANVNGEFVWDELAGSMSIVGVMICFEIIIKNLSHGKIASCIISLVNILVILPYIIFFVYSAATGDVIDVNSLVAVYQTNINESIEFFRSYIDSFSIILLFGLLAFSAVVIMYANNNTTIDKFFGRNMLVNVVNIFAFIAYMGLAYKTVNFGYFGKISVESKQYLESVRNFNKLRYNSDGTKKPSRR